MSRRAGALEDGWLPRTARAMAHLLAQGTSRDAVSISNDLVRIPYSRSSFERIGHAVSELYVARQEGIDKALARDMEIPDTAMARAGRSTPFATVACPPTTCARSVARCSTR